MADVGENLKAFLEANAAVAALVGNRVFQDHVPQATLTMGPFIAFRLADSSSDNERCLDDAVGAAPFRFMFNLDAVAKTAGKEKDIRAAVNSALNNYGKQTRTFGDTTIQGVFCEDQSDDYEPFSVSADSGLRVAGLSVEVIP